jgi:hypothetical protein
MLRDSYIRNVEEEVRYRKLSLNWKDTLQDTFQACSTITWRDAKDERFQQLQRGITNIVNFILERFTLEEAIVCAAKTAYLSRLIQADRMRVERYTGPEQIATFNIGNPEFLKWNRLKKTAPAAFFYWYKALEN